jgi:hypothetical protein
VGSSLFLFIFFIGVYHVVVTQLKWLKKTINSTGAWLRQYAHPSTRDSLPEALTFFISQQGMDDRVVSPAVAEFVRRVVPGATVHRLLDEGHFSYFCFCDECHRQIFSTLFGIPQGPINPVPQPSEVASELAEETTAPDNVTEQEQGKSNLA